MKGKKTRSRVLVAVAAGLTLLLTAPAYAQTPTDGSSYGSKAALQDSSYTFEEMLTYAIQDEYLAKATYKEIIANFGAVRPFTNIRNAEERHIQALTYLFAKYNLPLPEDRAGSYVVLPANLREAYAAGVQAEIDNIAMYDRFLAVPDLPADAQAVFSNLRSASYNHLAAFQRHLR